MQKQKVTLNQKHLAQTNRRNQQQLLYMSVLHCWKAEEEDADEQSVA